MPTDVNTLQEKLRETRTELEKTIQVGMWIFSYCMALSCRLDLIYNDVKHGLGVDLWTVIGLAKIRGVAEQNKSHLPLFVFIIVKGRLKTHPLLIQCGNWTKLTFQKHLGKIDKMSTNKTAYQFLNSVLCAGFHIHKRASLSLSSGEE